MVTDIISFAFLEIDHFNTVKSTAWVRIKILNFTGHRHHLTMKKPPIKIWFVLISLIGGSLFCYPCSVYRLTNNSLVLHYASIERSCNFNDFSWQNYKVLFILCVFIRVHKNILNHLVTHKPVLTHHSLYNRFRLTRLYKMLTISLLNASQ